MSNPWFRLYSEFSHDPKVQMMSESMQRRYIMIMCMRCSNDLVTLQETELAFHLRITDAELADTKALFVSKGFIDAQWNLLNWEKRQFKSDSSATRVARHRAHKKDAGNGDVTLQKRQCNALDTDTDTDTDKNLSSANASSVEPTPFDKFWQAYPRKTGKGAALKAWMKMKNHRNLVDVIIQALDWQKTSDQWTKDAGQYVPNPATYLNQERWTDEPISIMNQQKGKSRHEQHSDFVAELTGRNKRKPVDDPTVIHGTAERLD